MKKLHKLPKHTKHVLRIMVFVIAVILGIVFRKYAHSGIISTTADFLLGTVVDRIFPQGSFFGSIDSN